MNNDLQAEMTRNQTTETQMGLDSGCYTGNVKLNSKFGEFKVANSANRQAAAAAFPDNSGYSALKNEKKIELSETASTYSGLSHVALTDLGKIDIADTLHVNETDYSSLADVACQALAQSAHDIMLENVEDLGEDVTEAMLEAFQDEIDAYGAVKGTSDAKHEESPALTEAFENSFVPIRKIIVQLKMLLKPYKKTNKAFYDRVIAAMEIPAVNVHHTYVNICVTEKGTGKAMEGVVFTLTKGQKTGSSNWEGLLTLERMKNGEDVLTGVFNGKVVVLAHINIKRGRANDFTFEIEVE